MRAYFSYLKETKFCLQIKNWVHYALLLLQVTALVVSITTLMSVKAHPYQYEIPLESFELRAGAMVDGALYVDETAGGSTHFMIGPYMPLERGSYRLTIQYEATKTPGYLFMYDGSTVYSNILADKFELKEGNTTFSTDVYIQTDLQQFECRIIYMGEGSLKVTSVVLEETAQMAKRDIVYVFGMVMAIQLLYLLSYYSIQKQCLTVDNKYVVLGLVATWVLVSYPLFSDYLFNGHDITFHLKRIEGIKEGLLSGQFPVRVQPGWWNGAGYAVSVYYADTFLYIPAVLRILGFTVQEAFRIYLLLCNAATVGIAYFSFVKISQNKKAALLGTLIYSTAIYRMTCLYIRAAIGEMTAMIFLPLVLYGFMRILRYDAASEKDRFAWLPLTLGMTGILNSHILSTELAVMLLIVLCLVFVKTLLKKKRWLLFVKAAGAFLLANLWFIVPFLDYYTDGHKISLPTTEVDIQKTGTFWSQIFMTFPEIVPSSGSASAEAGIGNEMALGIGLPVFALVGLVILLYMRRREVEDKRINHAVLVAAVGGLFIVFSTTVFPWNKIAGSNELLKSLVFIVQYLWRYLGIAILCLCGAGVMAFAVYQGYESKEKVGFVAAVIAGLAVCMVLSYNDSLMNNTTSVYRIYSSESVECVWDTFYLPEGSTAGAYMSTNGPVADADITIGNVVRNGLELDAEIANNGTESVVKMPLVYYEGYQAVGRNSGKELQVMETEDKFVGIVIPANYADVVAVFFEGKWYWHMAEVFSLLTMLGFIIYSIRMHRKGF